MEFTSDGTPTGDVVARINSGWDVYVFNALNLLKGSGFFNLEVLTGIDLWLPMLADVPVLTPTAFLPWYWYVKIMLTKGRQYFMGEPGQNTQMIFANSTGNIGWNLNSDDATAKFTLQPFTGGATAGLMWYTQWNVDGTIQAGNTGIIAAINAGPDETYVTKGWALSQWIWGIDATKIYTNSTGIIGFQVGNAQALTTRAIAMGDWSIADNDGVSIWGNNITTGNNSFWLWNGNITPSISSFTIWLNNKNNQYSTYILWGNNFTAFDWYNGWSFIIWQDNKLGSFDTTIIWRLNNSTGSSNMIIGLDSNLSGERLYSFWQSLLATGLDKYIFGQFNLPISGSMLEFGVGTMGLRKTAMVIMSDSKVGIGDNTPTHTLQVSWTSAFGNVSLNNYTQFSAWGFERRYGSGLARDDIQNTYFFDTTITANLPSRMAIGGGNIDTRCFDGWSQMNEMFGSVEIPHDMFLWTGAVLAPHVHMLAEQTEPAQTGIWYMDYMILSNGQSYSGAAVKTISGTQYGFTARKANVIELDWNIFTGAINIGDMVSYRIYRTPTWDDTYSSRMCLQQVWFHYQRDTNGSRERYSK